MTWICSTSRDPVTRAGIVGNVYLEGTWSEVYPNVTQDEAGLKELFKQFSFPGGYFSHVAPTTPGSIHEGGELGYSLSHAFGAAFDNPGLIVACVIGDGEAETGPLATSWQSNKFLDPVTEGISLPAIPGMISSAMMRSNLWGFPLKSRGRPPRCDLGQRNNPSGAVSPTGLPGMPARRRRGVCVLWWGLALPRLHSCVLRNRFSITTG